MKAEAETGEKRPQAKVLVPPETSRGRGTGPLWSLRGEQSADHKVIRSRVSTSVREDIWLS